MTYEQIARYLKAKVPDLHCDACGGDVWSIDCDEEGQSARIPMNKNFDYLMVIVVCVQCGQAKFLARRVIEQWLMQATQEPV